MKEGRKYKRLGDIVKTINGLWTGKKPPFKTVAVVRNTNFTKDCKLDMSNVAYIDVEERQYATRKLMYGDIIIEKSGGSDKQPVGRPVLFDLNSGEYSFSNFTSTLRINNKEEIIPKYLYRALYGAYLRGETFKMQSKTTGIHNLDFKAYNNLLIPMPTIIEQKHVVEELDLLSFIIEKKKAQLNELDNMSQSLFYEMFGNPMTNEKDWTRLQLKDKYNVKSSKRVYQSEQSLFGVPFLRVADIISKINKEQISPQLFISEELYSELKTKGLVPKAGDILVTSRGTLGRSYIVEKTDKFYFQDGMITWLESKSNDVNPLFVNHLLETKEAQIEMKKSSNTSTVAFISINRLAKMMIPIPPIDLQNQFAERVETIEYQKELIKKSIKEVETLFNSRMDYYFN